MSQWGHSRRTKQVAGTSARPPIPSIRRQGSIDEKPKNGHGRLDTSFGHHISFIIKLPEFTSNASSPEWLNTPRVVRDLESIPWEIHHGQ
jgi:hypothetical protein